MTFHQVRAVISIRDDVRRQLGGILRRLRRTEFVHTEHVTVPISLELAGAGTVTFRMPDESETDRMSRELEDQKRAVAELRRTIVELERRTQRDLDGRLAALADELDRKGTRDARLTWKGAALIGAGIVAQTVGSLM
ncbi:hypothetical protein OED52_04260 [Rhodococcus sp. Z13]|uniref:Uncharacterized protein n=1 Tax=Rhodococcus sacchari TaxID=2962047 RepID=A0ACD4DIB0_9NOCA|nr:hypothetical protein [Rhodococcus sp. Z13]UYP19778.1 hypothetical protein OED52_04260 [Rhodococcus sp. Z13]